MLKSIGVPPLLSLHLLFPILCLLGVMLVTPGNTPLHYAAWPRRAEHHRKAADPSVFPVHFFHPIRSTNLNPLLNVMSLFVTPGNTPLHYAACRGVLNIIVRLLASGAEPDMANVQGSTPLHKACMFGQNAVVKKLVE